MMFGGVVIIYLVVISYLIHKNQCDDWTAELFGQELCIKRFFHSVKSMYMLRFANHIQ